MSRLSLVLGMVLGLSGLAMAVTELAVIYNGETELPALATFGDWGYIPRVASITGPVAGRDIPVDNTYYFFPGQTITINDKDYLLERVTPETGIIRVTKPVTITEQTSIKVANPYQPIRVIPNKKFYGLHVTALGRYAGARIDFPKPLAIDNWFTEKNNFLELHLRAAANDAGVSSNIPWEGATETAAPAEDTAFPDEFLQEVEVLNPSAKPVTLPTLKNLRITFFTDKGQGQIVVTPDQFYPKDEVNNAWVRIGIPLSTIKSAAPLGSKLTRMLITSDEPTHFYVGRLAFVHDDTPFDLSFYVYPMFLEAKQRIFFIARPIPGLTRYEVVWNFDAKGNKAPDTLGERAFYTYDTEGTYQVTCTVRDVTGGKKSVTKSIELKVSRAEDE